MKIIGKSKCWGKKNVCFRLIGFTAYGDLKASWFPFKYESAIEDNDLKLEFINGREIFGWGGAKFSLWDYLWDDNVVESGRNGHLEILVIGMIKTKNGTISTITWGQGRSKSKSFRRFFT